MGPCVNCVGFVARNRTGVKCLNHIFVLGKEKPESRYDYSVEVILDIPFSLFFFFIYRCIHIYLIFKC